MGLEALEQEEDKEIEKEVQEEGEESMMDGAGKHFSTSGCKNKTRICVLLGRPPRCVTGEPSITSDTLLPPE